MQISKKSLLSIILVVSLLTTALGAMLVEKTLDTHMRIKPTVMLNVYDTDAVTPLTFIELGDFTLGETKGFPVYYELPITLTYFVNNSDQMAWYVGFWVENSPAQVVWGIHVRKGNLTTEHFHLDGVQADWKIYNQLIESSYTNADPTTQYATWLLTVNVYSTAEFGEYTPILHVGAFDTPTG